MPLTAEMLPHLAERIANTKECVPNGKTERCSFIVGLYGLASIVLVSFLTLYLSVLNA